VKKIDISETFAFPPVILRDGEFGGDVALAKDWLRISDGICRLRS